jgi:Ca2+-binding RTX toxin-like protein
MFSDAGIGTVAWCSNAELDTTIRHRRIIIKTLKHSGEYTKRGTVGDDVLTANSNGIWGGALYGEAGNDTLNGGSGSDQLHGGSGNDVLNGGSGNDMYYFERGGGQDQIIDSSGTDKVYFDVSITATDISLSRNANDLVLTVNNAGGTLSIKDYFATADNIVESFIFTDGSSLPLTLAIQDSFLNIRGTSADDDLSGTAYIDMIFGADGNDVLRGMAGNDTLYGNAGDDNLDGGLGNDTMVGAIGNDVYFVDSLSDVVTELVNEGIDTVNSVINYTLGSNIENLTLTGSAVSGTGNELDNVFRGNSIANTFAGGIGNDSYYLGTGDTVTENTNAGTDTVYTDATYTLGTNVENGILTGTATVNLTGNTIDNVLTGNAAANTLSGGAGSDRLIGAQGNDTYILDVATDIVIENLNEGNDTVQVGYATAATITLTLGAGQFSNVENVTVTGTGLYNLTGDAGDNKLIGNASANVLRGNAGNDVLNGMGGADTMVGGLGNDVYTVDMLTDSVTESLNEGIDLVNIAIATKSGTYTLGNNIENATLTSTVAYNVTGNALDNVLIGNAAANKLTGGAGNDTLDGGVGVDTMVGGTGDDIYIVDATRDVVTEAVGAGNDTVKSAVTFTLGATSNLENLMLTGTTAINATGNAYANLLMGNSANNTLTDTAGGNDVLQGLAGVDTFKDTLGNNLFDGGLGNDVFTAGAGNDMIIGGQGNDIIITGVGYDVIVFNKGDGQDIINASTGADNTISLGGNFAYSDLSLSKSANDLILKMGATDQITLKDWYLGTTNHSVVNLQVIAEIMPGFDLGGTDVLYDNNVENFNFANIVSAFDAAGATANWQLTDALLTTNLQSGSDSAAIGGELAYQYGNNSNLAGMGLLNAQSVISEASFGQTAQTLNNPTVWQTGIVLG